ncbi:MAG TPA: hypothetical protein VJ997_05600 [Longimicrobiales bacterium]|nr:hypothetical protein [Longimicrobiales bacterium]
MKSASAKAKGRRLQNEVASRVRAYLHLPEPDVKGAVMGEGGADLKLSDRAQSVFPFAVECKNVERLHLWKARAQAVAHAEKTGLRPLLVDRRNREVAWAQLPLNDLLELLAKLNGAR